MDAEYDGRQIVGIDLHRRRSVIVPMTAGGEQLSVVRISNDLIARKNPTRMQKKQWELPPEFPADTRPVPFLIGGLQTAQLVVIPAANLDIDDLCVRIDYGDGSDSGLIDLIAVPGASAAQRKSQNSAKTVSLSQPHDWVAVSRVRMTATRFGAALWAAAELAEQPPGLDGGRGAFGRDHILAWAVLTAVGPAGRCRPRNGTGMVPPAPS